MGHYDDWKYLHPEEAWKRREKWRKEEAERVQLAKKALEEKRRIFKYIENIMIH